MNILHVTAQKPAATGSGIYLTKLAQSLCELKSVGRQGILAGVYAEDLSALRSALPAGATLFPVVFDSEKLPFHIFGMSDVMPYPSCQYSDMTGSQLSAFKESFLDVAEKAVAQLNPDVILCHHLYLLTSLIREHFPEIPVYGFCHNTDLTQLRAHNRNRDYIRSQISLLDGIFALHQESKRAIIDLFNIPADKIYVIGGGYDPDIFYNSSSEHTKPYNTKLCSQPVQLIYAGKLSAAKGVPSLLHALTYVHDKEPLLSLSLTLAGGAGDEKEFATIKSLINTSPYPIKMTGRVSQKELASFYRKNDLFILPSFNEGLPLSVIEALACGLHVIMTDLPGVKEWISACVPDAPIVYVPPNPSGFEKKLADVMIDTIRGMVNRKSEHTAINLSALSWQALAQHVFEIISKSIRFSGG